MKHKRNLIIGIVVSVTATFVALQNVAAPTRGTETPDPGITVTVSVEPSATVVDASGGCAYMWAYHDDPQLSAKVDEAIRQLDPTASANAQLFGEDCVYADGRSTFGAMETDFYVLLPAEDLTAEEEFGNWVKQVMDIIAALPGEEIQGRKGFVEFSFIKSEAERIIFRVDVNEYLTNAANLTGVELFQKYYSPPPGTPGTTTP